MARGGAHRIDPAIFLDEGETGKPELVDLGLLLRRQLALDADEAAPGFELRAKLGGVDVGEHARHLLDQLILVDDARGVGVESRALDVGREQLAVAVENVGAVHGGGDVVQAAAARLGAGEAERHEAAADQDEGEREGEAGKAEAVAAPREIGPLGAGCGGIWIWRCRTRSLRLLGGGLNRSHDLGLRPWAERRPAFRRR